MFFFGFLVAAVVGGAVLAWFAWQGARQTQSFRDEIQAVQSERILLAGQVQVLLSRTTALQDRLAEMEANDLTRQIAELRAQLATLSNGLQLETVEESREDIQTRVDGLESSLDSLAARIAVIESDRVLPPKARLMVLQQKQGHTLSCEASAASMVAEFNGVHLAEEDVLSALPRNHNPNLGFRGNVDGTPGGIQDYGVYAGPIAAILEAEGLQARWVAGGLPGFRAAIARGNPVIAWVTYNLQPGTPITKTVEGVSVLLVPYQHVVVVTGYNREGFWVNDPWDGREHFYLATDLERALGYFDNMALEVGRP